MKYFFSKNISTKKNLLLVVENFFRRERGVEPLNPFSLNTPVEDKPTHGKVR
jgi:hypothetical protein